MFVNEARMWRARQELSDVLDEMDVTSRLLAQEADPKARRRLVARWCRLLKRAASVSAEHAMAEVGLEEPWRIKRVNDLFRLDGSIQLAVKARRKHGAWVSPHEIIVDEEV